MAFHVQIGGGMLKVAHLFNLEREQLLAEIVEPWRHAEEVEVHGRRWRVRDTALLILEGPRLAPSQLLVGQGWRNAARGGHDVTAELLASAGPSTSASPGVSARVALGGAPAARVEAVAASLFGLGLEPVPWLGGPPPAVQAALVVVGRDELGDADARALLLAGAWSALAPGRALILADEVAVPLDGPVPLRALELDGPDTTDELSRFLARAGCPVRVR